MPRLVLAALLALAACDSARPDAEIVRYTGPRLTEADATVPDPPFGDAGWQGGVFVSRLGPEVLLERRTSCGDECGRTLRLTFSGQRSGLPVFAAGEVEVGELLPPSVVRERIDIARVEIQDWGPEVYSGVVYPVPQPDAETVPIVFWADRLAVAVE